MPDQTPLGILYSRASRVLGLEAYRAMLNTPARRDAFLNSMRMDVESSGGPEKVTDQMILNNMQIAHEMFPVEAEVLSKAFFEPTE